MLFTLKKKEQITTAGGQQIQAGQLRVQKDLEELTKERLAEQNITMSFPNGANDIMNIRIVLRPQVGYWKGGAFTFNVAVPSDYPHVAPKITCENTIYHPNIDLQGKVCLNILREDFKPTLTLNIFFFGLGHLFLDPNPGDPLNEEAAKCMESNATLFQDKVNRSMRGMYMDGTQFTKVI